MNNQLSASELKRRLEVLRMSMENGRPSKHGKPPRKIGVDLYKVIPKGDLYEKDEALEKEDSSDLRMLTKSEIESLRQDKKDAHAYCQKAFAHLRPKT